MEVDVASKRILPKIQHAWKQWNMNGCCDEFTTAAEMITMVLMQASTVNMERAYNALTMPQTIKREDAEDQYHSTFAVVRRHVNKALEEGMNQIKYQASNSERQEIQELSNNLDFDYFDKQGLDAIIQQANDIFHKYGL